MNSSNSRNRRLVTYGTTKSQLPKTNTTSTKIVAKDTSLSSRSRSSRHVDSGLQGNKEDDRSSGASGATSAPVLAQSQSTTESSVYDLPSSDAENPTNRRRRKRVIHHTKDTKNQSPAKKRTGRHNNSPNSASLVVNDGDVAMPQIVDNLALEGGVPPNIFKENFQRPRIGDSSYLRAGRSVQSGTAKHVPGNAPSDPIEKSPRVVVSGTQPSPDSDRRHEAVKNTTPGRKRLIDSLGCTRPAFGSPSKRPAACKQSQNSIQRSSASPAKPNVPVDEGHVDNNAQASPTAGPSHTKTSGVTYARQRSFLDDMLLEDDLTDIPGLKNRPRTAHPQSITDALSSARLMVVNEEPNDDGSVRSIHELRQAGGNARYRGAVESIFEDIEDTQNSLSGRCNAFLQLCGKLLDTRLKSRFLECNFDKRLADCLSIDLRVMPITLALCTFALGSPDGNMSYVLAASAWPKLLEISSALLDIQDDITKVAKAQSDDLARPLQKTIQNIAPRISELLFPQSALLQISPCIMTLYCLRITISTMQTKGERPSGFSTSLFEALMRLLLSETQQCVSHKMIPAKSFEILCMVLSVLEAFTASLESDRLEYRNVLRPLSTLHGLFYLSGNYAGILNQQIQSQLVRVILNVTNSNPAICVEFATRELVGGLVHIVTTNFGDLTEDALGQENNPLNSVILALGALINLTEQSEASRSIFLRSAGSHQSFLDRLLHLFKSFVGSISTVCSSNHLSVNMLN